MVRLYNSGLSLRAIGEIYGISRQTVSQRVLSTNIPLRGGKKGVRIEKAELEEYYSEKNYSLLSIAEHFGTSIINVENFLELYKIPPRGIEQFSGNYDDFMQKLEIGETREIAETIKSPQSALHLIARRARIKIKVRRAGENRFRVTRIQ